MILRCGDVQRGYHDLAITFSGVTVDDAAMRALRQVTQSAEAEVLYDEVDRAGSDFEYRLLLFPEGDVSIVFRDVALQQTPKPDRYAR
jgi:hypothetical protein